MAQALMITREQAALIATAASSVPACSDVLLTGEGYVTVALLGADGSNLATLLVNPDGVVLEK